MTQILAISGSLRDASTNTAALRTAVALAPEGTTVTLFEGLKTLPHFNPDNDIDPLPAAVEALRHAVRSCDAVLFSTPEYAGTLPGSFKNLLDWMVGGTELNDKPVGWINTHPVGRGTGATTALMTVLHYVTANIIDEACVHVTIGREQVGLEGFVADDSLRAQIIQTVETLVAGIGPTS